MGAEGITVEDSMSWSWSCLGGTHDVIGGSETTLAGCRGRDHATFWADFGGSG